MNNDLDLYLSPVNPEVWSSARSQNDKRIANFVQLQAPIDSNAFVIVGFAEDRGVQKNGGVRGAAAGPNAIRHALARCSLVLDAKIVDLGNITPQNTLIASQQALATVVSHLLDKKAFPLILGGGHETSFGHFLGYANSARKLIAINFDAHLDLRPYETEGHSGSPFRQMFEHQSKLLNSYWACGIELSKNNSSILTYAKEHQVFIRERKDCLHNRLQSFVETANAHAVKNQATMLASLDLDAISESEMPAVSARNGMGCSKKAAYEYISALAHSAALCSLDIVELNPSLDQADKGARLAANLIAYFIDCRAKYIQANQ